MCSLVWNSQERSGCPCPWAPWIRRGAEIGIRVPPFPGLYLSVLAMVVAILAFGPRDRMEYGRPLGLGEVPVSVVLRWDLSFSSRTSLLSVLWPRMEVTALESPEREVPISSRPLVAGWTLNRFPHVTRCLGPGSWAPGISFLESDGWPSFPFSAVWPRPSIPRAFGGPPPRLWRNKDSQLLADARCSVTLNHKRVRQF